MQASGLEGPSTQEYHLLLQELACWRLSMFESFSNQPQAKHNFADA